MPLPDPLDEVLSHDAELVADQVQPVPTVIVNDPGPPPGATVTAEGLMAKAHGGAAPSCATVNVCPPTVIVPVRGAVVAFAAMA